MQKKYPFEDNFLKTFQLLEYINKQPLVLEKEQLEKIINNLEIKDIEKDNNLIESILKLFKYNYSKKLEDLVFELLEKFVNDKKKCRGYIEHSYNIEYSYNVRLFNFMKKHNLFMTEAMVQEVYSNRRISNGLEQTLFFTYKNNCKKISFLLQYIPYHFFYRNFTFNTKTEELFIFISKIYKSKIISFSGDYNRHYGLIIYSLLANINTLKKLSFKDIVILSKDIEISFNTSNARYSALSLEEKFGNLNFTEEFWNIYFSDEIDNFEQIKEFVNLYHISEKDIELATKQYPIEDYIEKYYDLAVKYKHIDVLMSNANYCQFIEKKKEDIDSLNNFEKYYLSKIIQIQKDKEYSTNIKNYSNEKNFDIFFYVLSKKNNNFKETDKKLREDLKDNYSNFIKTIIIFFTSLNKYDNNCNYENRFHVDNYLFNILPTKEAIDNALKSNENYEKLFWYIINGCISIENRELFKIIEDKFELFLKVVKEYIEVILEKKNINCFDSSMKWEHNMVYSPCRQIIDIFYNISFDSEQKIWNDFLKYIETKKENEPQYNEFFKLIIDINFTKERLLKLIKKNNKDSLSYFETLFQSDMNKALEYFYKYIYDPIPYKISYKLQNNNSPLFSLNYLFSRYLTESNINLKVENSIDINTGSYIDYTNIQTDKEKKINAQKEFKRKLFEFCKDKNCSYNIVKIILFNKLLNLFHYDFDFKNLNKQYIEKIFIDYYSLFKEKEVPISQDFYINNNYPLLSKNDSENSIFFNPNKSKASQIIISIWGYLQTNINEEKIELLEKLKKNENTYISNSANYTLDRVYEKQEKDRSFGNEYYDKGILPITSIEDFYNDVCKKLEKLKVKIEDNRDNDKSSFYRDKKLEKPRTEEECRDVIYHRLKDRYNEDIELIREKYEANNRVDINIKSKKNLKWEIQVECKRDNYLKEEDIENQLISRYFSSEVEYGIYLIFYFNLSKKSKEALLENIKNPKPNNIKIICIDLTFNKK